MPTLKTNPFPINLAGVDTSKDNKVYGYTPTWTGATANPVLGNGSMSGWYSTRGDLVLMSISMVMGGTTTFGTGMWSWSIPSQMAVGRNATGSIWMLSAGVAFYTGVTLAVAAATTIQAYYSGVGGGVQTNVPFVWKATDQLVLTLEYPIR
jgi:hypothetical protein